MDELYEQILFKRIRPSTVLVSNRKSKKTWYYVVFGLKDNKIIGHKYLNKIPLTTDSDFLTDVRWFQSEILPTDILGNFDLSAKQLRDFHVVKQYDYYMDRVLKRNLESFYHNLIYYTNRVVMKKQIQIGSVLHRGNTNFYTVVIELNGDKYVGTNISRNNLKGCYNDIIERGQKGILFLFKSDISDFFSEDYVYINTLDIKHELLKLKMLGYI